MPRRTILRRALTLPPLLLAALLAAGSLAAAIDTDAERRGAISGTVVEAATGEIVPLVEIQVWNEAGDYVEAALTDMHGLYAVDDLPAGRYFASTMESGFRDELFDDRPCPIGECDPTAGTPIEVRGGATTTDVDFMLER